MRLPVGPVGGQGREGIATLASNACSISYGYPHPPTQPARDITGLVSPESRSKLYMWRLGARRQSGRQRGRGKKGERRGCGGESGHGQEEAVARRQEETRSSNVFQQELFHKYFRQRNTQLRSTRTRRQTTAAKHTATSTRTREANDEKTHTWLFNKKKGGGRLVCIINRTKCNTSVPVRAPPPPPVMRPL